MSPADRLECVRDLLRALATAADNAEALLEDIDSWEVDVDDGLWMRERKAIMRAKSSLRAVLDVGVVKFEPEGSVLGLDLRDTLAAMTRTPEVTP